MLLVSIYNATFQPRCHGRKACSSVDRTFRGVQSINIESDDVAFLMEKVMEKVDG